MLLAQDQETNIENLRMKMEEPPDPLSPLTHSSSTASHSGNQQSEIRAERLSINSDISQDESFTASTTLCT